MVNEAKKERNVKLTNAVIKYIDSDFDKELLSSIVANYGLSDFLYKIIPHFEQPGDEKREGNINRFLAEVNEFVCGRNLSTEDIVSLDLFLGDLDHLSIRFSVKLSEDLMFSLREQINISARNCVSSMNAIKQRCFNGDRKKIEEFENSVKKFKYTNLKNIKDGQVFGVRAIDLVGLNFYETSKRNEHCWWIMSSSFISPLINDENDLLILIYIGDNKAMEYYTGKIINIEPFHNENRLPNRGYYSPSEFVTPLSKIKESPLVICEDEKRKDMQFFEINEEFNLEFASQAGEKAATIKAAIVLMDDYYGFKLSEKLGSIYARDRKIAEQLDDVETGIVQLRKKAENFMNESK